MTSFQRTHLGHPSSNDIDLVDELLGNIEHVLTPLQEKLHDHKGRKAETSLRAFYAYGVLNEMAGNRATIVNVLAVARGLDSATRLRWGDSSPDQSYKRLTTLARRISKLLGSKGFDIDDEATALLQAQLDAVKGVDFGTAIAFDGTVFRSSAVTHYRNPTTAERRTKSAHGRNPSTQVAWCKDPDAAHGHYPSKDGQTKFAMGYEAHLACPVPTVKGQDMPIVAAAMSLQPNSTATRPAIRDLLIRLKKYDTVIFDAGYDFKGKQCFQEFLANGISPIFDPNKKLRKGQSSSHGKLIIDGDEFCPSTPKRLRDLPSLAQSLKTAEREKLEGLYDERARYMMARVSYGAMVRSMCPALAGKVACPQRPESLNNYGATIPKEIVPPENPPKCCIQKTTSTPVALLRRSRQGQHPYGTTDWGRLYRQRNRIESYNASIRHNIGNMAERSWTRVFGREKIGMFLTFKLLATNIRNIESFLHTRR